MEGQFNEALLIVSSFFIVFLFIWINSLHNYFNYRNLFGLIKAITILSFGAFYIKTDQQNHKRLSYLVPYTQYKMLPYLYLYKLRANDQGFRETSNPLRIVVFASGFEPLAYRLGDANPNPKKKSLL